MPSLDLFLLQVFSVVVTASICAGHQSRLAAAISSVTSFSFSLVPQEDWLSDWESPASLAL